MWVYGEGLGSVAVTSTDDRAGGEERTECNAADKGREMHSRPCAVVLISVQWLSMLYFRQSRARIECIVL